MTLALKFGYYPERLDFRSNGICVRFLSSLATTVDAISQSNLVEDGWIYGPPKRVQDMFSREIRELPYPSRVFGLEKTHEFEHPNPDSDEHIHFHIWVLSFFVGMRLTTSEAGFLDSTPLKPGTLVDFFVRDNYAIIVDLAERFWKDHSGAEARRRWVAAAVHALFLAQNPRNLQFERFMYLYTALDACYALEASINPPPKKIAHKERVTWLCNQFNMVVPVWAALPVSGSAEVASIRNETFHEALFMGEPLGFALHGVGTNQNLTLEMSALVCRLLVALLGAPLAEYVRTPTTTQQMHGLKLI